MDIFCISFTINLQYEIQYIYFSLLPCYFFTSVILVKYIDHLSQSLKFTVLYRVYCGDSRCWIEVDNSTSLTTSGFDGLPDRCVPVRVSGGAVRQTWTALRGSGAACTAAALSTPTLETCGRSPILSIRSYLNQINGQTKPWSCRFDYREEEEEEEEEEDEDEEEEVILK